MIANDPDLEKSAELKIIIEEKRKFLHPE